MFFDCFDCNNFPKALSIKEIEQLSSKCYELFACHLPDGYKAFLMKTNGFSNDGYSVFCYFNDEMQSKFPYYSGLDLISFNTKFQENTDIHDFLMLGKSSIDYLAYDKKKGEYVIMSNGILRIINKSTDFEAILEKFFRL